ncbi:DUF1931 family protein [Streptomyces sp. NPDC059852]|uniref:DUF1931 family protein n=1 Tax=Streptomyces sp. NPDC059852 TaxID=3346972 RepID=UPI00365C2C47
MRLRAPSAPAGRQRAGSRPGHGRESIHRLRAIDEELELKPILEQLAIQPALDRTPDDDTEAAYPGSPADSASPSRGSGWGNQRRVAGGHPAAAARGSTTQRSILSTAPAVVTRTR